MKNLFYDLLLIACLAIVNLASIDKVHAQNLERFQNEVDAIVERYAPVSYTHLRAHET